MKRVRAIIRWIPRSKGGRTAPPFGPKYWGVVRFEDERIGEGQASWSLEVANLKSLRSDGRVVLARISFIAPEAPTELLVQGARFEFCEGRHVVAKGVVLPERMKVPDVLDPLTVAVLG